MRACPCQAVVVEIREAARHSVDPEIVETAGGRSRPAASRTGGRTPAWSGRQPAPADPEGTRSPVLSVSDDLGEATTEVATSGVSVAMHSKTNSGMPSQSEDMAPTLSRGGSSRHHAGVRADGPIFRDRAEGSVARAGPGRAHRRRSPGGTRRRWPPRGRTHRATRQAVSPVERGGDADQRDHAGRPSSARMSLAGPGWGMYAVGMTRTLPAAPPPRVSSVADWPPTRR